MPVTQSEVDVAAALDERGWALVEEVLDAPFVERLNEDLMEAASACRHLQRCNGVDVATDGTVHHLPAFGVSFLELLERNVCGDDIDRFFGGKWILNSFGGVINKPGRPSYVCNVHRDVRFFTGSLPVMLNMLVMLDDFTEPNGATYLLSGSHRQPGKPTDPEFYARSDRAVGSRGSVLLFNANVWHAAGHNETDAVRRALTLTFTKPCFKPQLDYCRLIGDDRIAAMSPAMQQVLGYHARVPASLDEWYRKPEERFYRRGQD